MASKVDIPLHYPGAPPELKRDLERLASALDNFFRSLDRTHTPRWKYLPPASADTFAAFESIRPVTPRTSATVNVQLPQAKNTDGGRELRVQRMNQLGSIYLVPTGGALINGETRYHMLATIGFVTVQWDGTGYYTEKYGAAP